MAVYLYVRLAWGKGKDSPGAIWVTATDPDIMDWIADQAKVLDLTVKGIREDRLPTMSTGAPGELFRIRIEADEAEVMFWWVVRQLCRQGWEPFAITPLEEWADEVMHFRLRIDGGTMQSVLYRPDQVH